MGLMAREELCVTSCWYNNDTDRYLYLDLLAYVWGQNFVNMKKPSPETIHLVNTFLVLRFTFINFFKCVLYLFPHIYYIHASIRRVCLVYLGSQSVCAELLPACSIYYWPSQDTPAWRRLMLAVHEFPTSRRHSWRFIYRRRPRDCRSLGEELWWQQLQLLRCVCVCGGATAATAVDLTWRSASPTKTKSPHAGSQGSRQRSSMRSDLQEVLSLLWRLSQFSAVLSYVVHPRFPRSASCSMTAATVGVHVVADASHMAKVYVRLISMMDVIIHYIY